MGLRYRIPFKDSDNTEYEVRIYREDYNADVKELTGATSCFVVSGNDEDFMYTPVRASSATIHVLDSELLLDLYSINNQYAAVKLYRNGLLEWTGYIKPEQFTQPYVPSVADVSVECVCALSTLEHQEYKELNNLKGVVSLWVLLKHLVNSAKGGYNAVYIPWIYSSTSDMSGNVFEQITLIENNFIKEEMTLMEVLEAVCKFLNWTIYDINGSLWFVDHDWNGTYRKYDEALNNYSSVQGNDILLQDVGFNGSGGNTLDIVPGYNKASVKSINNVFDDVVKDEDYDSLRNYRNYFVMGYYNNNGKPYACRKRFVKPRVWDVYSYNEKGNRLSEEDLDNINPPFGFPEGMEAYGLNLNVYGAILMTEANFEVKNYGEPTPAEGVKDYNYVDSIQVRVNSTLTSQGTIISGNKPVVIMKGENAVYADCAISIDGEVYAYYDDDMFDPADNVSKNSMKLNISVSCGNKWYNGNAWVENNSSFWIDVDENGKLKTNRTPDTPYKGISGYVIPMDFFIGEPIITIMAPQWMESGDVRYYPGVKIRNLKFGYAKKEGIIEEGEEGDRIYENVVNELYMSDAEEITFEISSYKADGASFSKALLDGRWLTNNLFCKVVNEMVRPEELMIRRIVNRYGETKIKLTEALCMSDEINPLTTLSDRAMVGKRFRMTSGEWDYEQNRLVLQIQEDVE